MEFIKLHGTGNDFIFADTRQGTASKDLSSGTVRALCDRHFGIGADGILAFHDVQGHTPCMRIHNADGSIAEMCGNGLRCFVKALVDHFQFDMNPMTVLTDAGPKVCRHRQPDHSTTMVEVSMGSIQTLDGSRPLSPGVVPEALEIDGKSVSFFTASTGNPHAVLMDHRTQEEMRTLGPMLSTHPRFPNGVNVGFLTPISARELALTVHERGAGFTLACGTGAVAATAIAGACGVVPLGEPVSVRLPGGSLQITVEDDFCSSIMEGPAIEVFRGATNLPVGP